MCFPDLDLYLTSTLHYRVLHVTQKHSCMLGINAHLGGYCLAHGWVFHLLHIRLAVITRVSERRLGCTHRVCSGLQVLSSLQTQRKPP